MTSQSSVHRARPLLTGLAIGESPRWREGRLWCANWGTDEIVAVDLEGHAEVVGLDRRVSGGQSTGCPTIACW